jgi:hypothetical protein
MSCCSLVAMSDSVAAERHPRILIAAMYPSIQYFASKTKRGGGAGGSSNGFIDSPPSFSGKIRLVPRVISRV